MKLLGGLLFVGVYAFFDQMLQVRDAALNDTLTCHQGILIFLIDNPALGLLLK